MSEFRIKDGGGTGQLVRVTENRLWADSRVQTSMASVSDLLGYAFSWSLGVATLPGTSEYAMLRIENTDPGRHLHVERAVVSWNGGSTNYNRMLKGALYVGMTVPSANSESLTANSLNVGQSITAPASSQRWDEVGNGMTVSSNGVLAFKHLFGPGLTNVEFGGSLVLPFGQAYGITFQGTEVGDFGFTLSGWFEETHKT